MQVVWPDYTLGDVLKIFKQGKSHLSLVRDVNSSGEVIFPNRRSMVMYRIASAKDSRKSQRFCKSYNVRKNNQKAEKKRFRFAWAFLAGGSILRGGGNRYP